MDFLKDYVVLIVLGICLCVGFIIKNIMSLPQESMFLAFKKSKY